MAFNDGGPAFPQLDVEVVSDTYAVTTAHGGMSLWDFYAAAALAGAVGAPDVPKLHHPVQQIAEAVGDFADAMIAEREKRHATS